jgi:hypothetical protein
MASPGTSKTEVIPSPVVSSTRPCVGNVRAGSGVVSPTGAAIEPGCSSGSRVLVAMSVNREGVGHLRNMRCQTSGPPIEA